MREQLEKAHRTYGHVAPKRPVGFKKKGRIYSSLIPDKGRLEFKAKHCPICLAMKGKKPGKPSKLNLQDKANLGLWEKVCVDTAGKFRVAFFRKNRYYSVFICAKTGMKLYFPHKKEISFSAGISQICRACRVFSEGIGGRQSRQDSEQAFRITAVG